MFCYKFHKEVKNSVRQGSSKLVNDGCSNPDWVVGNHCFHRYVHNGYGIHQISYLVGARFLFVIKKAASAFGWPLTSPITDLECWSS